MDLEFEWDPPKDAVNKLKHGIDFRDAVTVFQDPHHVEEDSTKPEHGERRSKAIGLVGDDLLAVVFTERGDFRRIVSARRARKNERARYDQGKIASGWDRRSNNGRRDDATT